MNSISERLKEAIRNDYQKLRNTFTSEPYYALQILIRRYDFIWLFYHSSQNLVEDDINESREFYNFGWGPLAKKFLDNIEFDKPRPFIQTHKEDYRWADSVLQYSGRLATCTQLLDYEKANIVRIVETDENHFEAVYLNEKIGDAYFERKSVDFVRDEVMERVIREKRLKDDFIKDTIKKALRKVIRNPEGKFISYCTTTEIDEYYDREGYYRILKMNNYEDFDDEDTFGNIQYRHYVDFVQTICGVSIMHVDACIELCSINPDVDMHNILTYTFYKDQTIQLHSEHTGLSCEHVEQIISCVTLNKENYRSHLETPGNVPPVYFEVAENLLIRSAAGCIGNPFFFLNRELKRKFKKDYDTAVNNRENRFRKDLFVLFKQQRIIKVPNEVRLSWKGFKTDIDAIIYDVETGTLGLFQLKWQDPFGHSMKERYSRMTNMFPKAKEWLEKTHYWVSSNTPKTILDSLQVCRHYPRAQEITDIYFFVISRYDMHFTNNQTDDRAAWGSWYQLVEAQTSVDVRIDNPIEAMFVRLKVFTPQFRSEKEEMPKRKSFEAKVGEYKMVYKAVE